MGGHTYNKLVQLRFNVKFSFENLFFAIKNLFLFYFDFLFKLKERINFLVQFSGGFY